MNYMYDSYGWYIGQGESPRSTPITPGPCGSTAQKPNWTGQEWVCMLYTPPPAQVVPINPSEWVITPGKFITRLGMDGLAISASTDDVCKAASIVLINNSTVDLRGTTVAEMLNMLIAYSQPAANPLFPGSGPMTAAKRDVILNTKPTPDELA